MLAFRPALVEDVLWSITDRCNLRCVYCSVADDRVSARVMDLTPATIDRVVAQLQALPRLSSVILSGGEALLSPAFPYALERTSNLAPNVYVITNGVRLPSAADSALATHRPSVMVTIDSTVEAVNQQTRGPDVLRRALATLASLQARGLSVVVIVVVTRLNIAGIPADLEALVRRGVRNVLLQQLHCEGRSTARLFLQLSPTPTQIGILYARLRDLEARVPDLHLDYNEICFFPMRVDTHACKCLPSVRYKPQRLFMCGAGVNFFAIKTNGDVIPCNALRECIFGNLLTQDLLDVLGASEEANNVRRLRSLRTNSIPGCRGCAYAPVCDGGCRADVLHLTGDILAKHPYCNVVPMAGVTHDA